MIITNRKNEVCNITTVSTDIKRKIRMYNEKKKKVKERKR